MTHWVQDVLPLKRHDCSTLFLPIEDDDGFTSSKIWCWSSRQLQEQDGLAEWSHLGHLFLWVIPWLWEPSNKVENDTPEVVAGGWGWEETLGSHLTVCATIKERKRRGALYVCAASDLPLIALLYLLAFCPQKHHTSLVSTNKLGLFEMFNKSMHLNKDHINTRLRPSDKPSFYCYLWWLKVLNYSLSFNATPQKILEPSIDPVSPH